MPSAWKPENRSARGARLTCGITAAFLTALLAALPAQSHETHSHADGAGFLDGLIHPLLGGDHIAAMIAVGIWGAFLGRPLIWVLPLVFPVTMALGSVYGILGYGLPFSEPAIALSSVAIGLSILAAWRAPILLAGLIIAFFAVFHGYAHGAELPGTGGAASYALGFVTSTGLLHLCGIAFGLLVHRPRGALALRLSGGFIAMAGLVFLFRLA